MTIENPEPRFERFHLWPSLEFPKADKTHAAFTRRIGDGEAPTTWVRVTGSELLKIRVTLLSALVALDRLP
jgi:hypothetical protein